MDDQAMEAVEAVAGAVRPVRPGAAAAGAGRMVRQLGRAGLIALALGCVGAAHAAVHTYDVLVDLDANAATGCTVSTPQGAAAGIDRRLRITVTTNTTAASVTSIVQEDCANPSTGAFGAATALPGTPYAVALGNGSGGTAAIEAEVALASIPANPNPTLPTVIRLAAAAQAADGSADALLPPAALTVRAGRAGAPDLREVPTLGAGGLLVLFGGMLLAGALLRRHLARLAARGPLGALLAWGLGLALFAGSAGWVAAITRDGLVNDWAGTSALLTGPRGNATGPGPSGSADLVALYAKVDGAALALRVDAALELEPPPPPPPGDPAIVPIGDRVIELGTRFQQLVQATSPNLAETLTVSLPTAPAGAALAPAPLIDWTPTAAQLGVNDFTARVTDSGGRTASASFRVTVVRTNRAPVLAVQPDATLSPGATFTRTLAATDPDGDALVFELVNGPAGLTLAGATLTWNTSGAPAGTYPVTVRVRDPGGLTDTRTFSIVLATVQPPVARDDSYRVQLGQTLAVPARGVLSNDSAAPGRTLTARKLTDPAKGAVTAFGPDGSFTYTAPATNPPPAFDMAVTWRNSASGQWINTFPVVGDVNGDGAPDFVYESQFTGVRAVSGRDGSTLWSFADPAYADCGTFLAGTTSPLLADVDDDGQLEYVTAMICQRDNTGTTANVSADRIVAIDGRNGRVKWISPPISASLGDVLAPGTPPSTEDRYQHVYAGAAYASPTVARLAAGEAPTVLFRKVIRSDEGFYRAAGGSFRSAGCRALTGRAQDDGQGCRVTVLLDGNGGNKRFLVAPNPSGFSTNNTDPMRELSAFAVDLDGDGVPEIVSGSDVWKNVGGTWTLLWQTRYEPTQALAADLDGAGRVDVVHVYAFPKTGGSGDPQYGNFAGIIVYDGATGAEKRRIRLPIYWTAWLTIADADGDGRPDFVINSNGTVFMVSAQGDYRWTYPLPEVPPPASPVPQGTRSGLANVQVYDLDGDGVPEVVTGSYAGPIVLDGRTGAVRARFVSAGLHPSLLQPVNVQLVDADDDGRVDILATNVSTTTGLEFVLLSGAPGNSDRWLPGPKAHHQADFMVGDIDAAGRVQFNAAAPRSFRNPRQLGSARDPRESLGTFFTYAANDGTADSAPARVFIEIEPANRPPVITTTPPSSLWQRANPTPPGGLFVNTYAVGAYDPDPGDTLSYALVSAPSWVTIDAATGVIRFEPTCGSFGLPCNWGWTFVTVRVTDSRGASTDQSFYVNLTTNAVSVPDVVGQSFGAASATLSGVGLTAATQAEIFDVSAPGTVLTQNPSAGTQVGAGGEVALVLSKGPAPVAVPYLVGRSLADANAALRALGLIGAVTTQSSTTIPPGQVMAQSPAGGTPVAPSAAAPVALTVAAGVVPPGTIAQIVVEPGASTRVAGEVLPYRATAVYANGTSADVTLNVVWNTSAPGVASVAADGRATALAAGAASITATLGALTGSSPLTVLGRTGTDATAPVALITAPADGGEASGRTTVTGTASDASFARYELALSPAGTEAWSVIAEGTSPVTAGPLGVLDTTTLVNDTYTLRLRVFDRGGNASEAVSSVIVRGDRKVGLFTLTFTDLNVALTGVPITVTRTYDSRDKSQGDFGIGWRLGLNTLRVRTNRVLGTGWTRTQSGISSSLSANGPHFATVTLPDGRVETFDLALSPTAGVGVLTSTRVSGFTPRPGTQGRLEVLGNTDLLVVNDGARDVLVDDVTLEPYDPRRFRYTTLDGTVIEIDRVEGVKQVTDRNGNAITYGPNGIRHSNGQGIVFARDALGRITSITDLNGRAQTYAYDANGDLVRHTDATGAASAYAYDRRHNLIDLKNALGVSMTRNEYDAQGRLVRMVDAAGNPIEFTLNDAANEQLITDRRGNVTRLVYDADGNVTRQERNVTLEGGPVLAVTTSAYDALGNETRTTDPDGRRIDRTFSGLQPLTLRTDPTGLNLATSFAYNAANDVTAATDPGGRSFTFSYDAAGNLTAASLPGFGASTVTSNAQGLPTQRIDALGTRTAMSYDAAGRLIREEVFSGATLLRRMEWSWDGNGNKLTETLYRTIGGTLTPLTTTMAYDAASRLIRRTDPAGGVTRWEYDAGGRLIAQTDALGRRTAHTYDTLGRKTRTDHPDGTFETTTYDAENNVVAETDRAGRTTTHAYDELNRRIRTTGPDGAVTRTLYSAGGRVLATIDARGHRTDYAYDAAGRRLSTQAPAVPDGPGGPLARPTVTQTLDGLGLPLTRTDPLGRVTSFQYDAEGRLVRTTHPDGTFVTQTWDALGRRTGVTNEEGQSTSFSYDGLGRLVGVSGHAGSATYAYDEAGNLVSETDALGRTNAYQYDALGRLIQRTYPGGQTTRFAYDAVGNLVARTDGLGRVIAWAYDAMNRPVSRTLPGGTTIGISYRPDGQRASVTDPRGVTTYAYDSAGRLASVTHPTGEVVSYAYDAAGNLVSLASPAATQTFSYDALDRLTGVTAPEGALAQAYDLAGNRVRRAWPNGLVSGASFDARNRPTQLAHALGATTLQSYATSWSPASRRTAIAESDGSVENYSYDGRGRLTGVTRTGTGPLTLAMSYDAVGNRTQLVRNGVTTNYSYDVNDRLTGDGASSYAWDANGNLVSRTQGANVTTYVWDAEDRLVGITGPGVSVQHVYDADGRRVRTTSGGATTRFLVDARNPTGYTQVLEERDATSGNLAARYTVGTELLAMIRGGAARSLLADPLGSVRALADPAGALTDTYRYDADGNLQAATGSTVNPIRWRGERLEESGLIDLRARMVSPALGRFLSRDPFEGRPADPRSRHRYLYAHADPVNFIDPSGRTTLNELSFVQGLNATLRTAYDSADLAKACTLTTTAKEVGNAVALLQLGTAAASLGAMAAGAVQMASGGNGPSISIGYETDEMPQPGLKKFGMHLTSGGGQLAVAFSFDFHSGALGQATFTLLPPPPNVNGVLGGQVEYVIKEFKICETATVGRAVAKAHVAGGAGAGATAYGVFRAGVDIEASLFKGGLKLSLPVLEFSYGPAGTSIAALGGLLPIFSRPSAPN